MQVGRGGGEGMPSVSFWGKNKGAARCERWNILNAARKNPREGSRTPGCLEQVRKVGKAYLWTSLLF